MNTSLPLRRWAGRCLLQLQGFPLYRRIGRRLARGIHVGLATGDELRSFFVPDSPGEEAFVDDSASVFIARKGRRMIGSHIMLRQAHETLPPKSYWLTGLEVNTPYRGMGIGQRLLDIPIQMARREGTREIGLAVYEDNGSAIQLYKKAGFERRIIPAYEEKLERERISPDRRMILLWKFLEARR
jgi:GNAT superfamily N-acetyltransferase